MADVVLTLTWRAPINTKSGMFWIFYVKFSSNFLAEIRQSRLAIWYCITVIDGNKSKSFHVRCILLGGWKRRHRRRGAHHGRNACVLSILRIESARTSAHELPAQSCMQVVCRPHASCMQAAIASRKYATHMWVKRITLPLYAPTLTLTSIHDSG